MLLIYSDMFKTFWLLVFPAVELVAGKIETDETFCQVSGFFLALSIEASDVSVALISVHLPWRAGPLSVSKGGLCYRRHSSRRDGLTGIH
jgi:hypothetical protein